MDTKPPVVLFADPDLTSTRTLRVELRRRGARVLMADTGPQAIRLAELFPPDVILLDDAVTAGGEPELSRYFRSAYPAAEIILLGSEDSGGPRGPGLGLLYSGRKPVSAAALLEVLEPVLGPRLPAPAGGGAEAGRILCVDDDPPYLNSIARLLTRHGYRVFPFGSAEQALAGLPASQPNLALVDIMMPGIDGLDLTEMIRKSSRGRIPVILVSAFASDEVCFRGHERGASYTLAKTCEPGRLLDVVDYFAGSLDADEKDILKTRL